MPQLRAHETDPVANRIAARRAWRIALVSYLVPLTVGTHWPRLALGGAEGGVDKLAHFLGFGLLAWMALHAAPWGRPWLGALFAAAWVAFDERTQGIEALGRVFSPADIVAGSLGVAMASLLYVVRDPASLVPGPLRDEALAREAFAYAGRERWVRATILAVVVASIVAWLMLLAESSRQGSITVGAIISSIALGGLFALILSTALSLRAARFAWERATGRASRMVRIPAWSWFLALPIASALFFGFWGALDAWYGPDPPEPEKWDRIGFVGLSRGFVVVAALVALCAADALAVRVSSARGMRACS